MRTQWRRRQEHQGSAVLVLIGVIALGVLAVSVALPWIGIDHKDLTLGGFSGFKIEYIESLARRSLFPPSGVGDLALLLFILSLVVGAFIGVALFVENRPLLAAAAFTGLAGPAQRWCYC